jgi:hypothetical protein
MNGCKKKENVDIPVDTLYEYFKNLNENDENEILVNSKSETINFKV